MDLVHFAQLLKSYPHMKFMIDEKMARIKELTDQKYDSISIPIANINGQPGGGGISDPTFQEVVRMCKSHDEEINRHCRELEEYKAKMDGLHWLMTKLEYVDPMEALIIHCYYFKRCGWHETARKVGYSERQCRRYHKAGIERALKLFNT